MNGGERQGGVRRVTVDLEAGPGPIQGNLKAGNGEQRCFSGWLELASALEALRPPLDAGILADREVMR